MTAWIDKHLDQGTGVLVTRVTGRTSTYWLTAINEAGTTVEKIKASGAFLQSISATHEWEDGGWIKRRPRPATTNSNPAWGSW